MTFKVYKFGSWKKEIRALLRERLKLKERIWYHKKRIVYHKEKRDILEGKKLFDVEKKLDSYLKKAGN